MNKLMEWLKNDFSPKMNKVNNNVWIVTLKDSVMQLLPFILLGSVFCLLTIPGDVYQIKNYPNFWVPFGWTMGMLSLLVSFLIPFNLMEKKKLRKQRFIAGCTSLIVFLIIISPQVVKDGTVGFSHSSLGNRRHVRCHHRRSVHRIYHESFRKILFFQRRICHPGLCQSMV
ncbi:hypothetical protein HMSSN036_39490 [Paenibacillus macerans]|nr:hypothetical protein HMSSN036_39490 [Paenibacillus macerans]